MMTTHVRTRTIVGLMVIAAAGGQAGCSSQVPATNTLSLNRHETEGWELRGRDADLYRFDTDDNVARGGTPSSTLLSTQASPEQFALMAQSVDASPYRTSRVRFSGYLKSLDVQKRAFLWLRVDSETTIALAFDDMHLRPLSGTTRWDVYEVLLDVPEHASFIHMGAGLIGPGQTWLSDALLEIVDEKFPSTDRGLEPISTGENAEDRFWVGALELSNAEPSTGP